MASRSKVPLAIAAGAAALLMMPRKRSSARSSSGKSFGPAGPGSMAGGEIAFPVFSGSSGAAEIERLGSLAGLDPDWVKFFQATAHGESMFSSNVVLGDPALYPEGSKPSGMTDKLGANEAAASRTAYARAAEQGRFEGCPWPKAAYTFGSGGWYGMIPSNAWAAYAETDLRCRHPWYILHPVDQAVTSIELARRLMAWSSFKARPTWLTLRQGWSSPSGMDNPKALARMRGLFPKHLEAVGLPTSWMDKKVTPLPGKNVVGLWNHLMETTGMPPGKIGA